MPAALQDRRLLSRLGFFILFVVAPPLDLFRLDLNLGHFILFGWDWTLGLDPFLRGEVGVGNAALNLLLRGFLPIALLGGGLLWISWRYGRLYCGWLCPHFSVVELINGLMRRASGKPTLWEKQPLPERQPDGSLLQPDRRLWPLTLVVVVRVLAAVGGGADDVSAATERDLRQLVQWPTHAQSECLHRRCDTGFLHRIPAGATFVLPLRLRHRSVSEPGVDGQQTRHGGRASTAAAPVPAPTAMPPATMPVRCV